MVQTLPSDDTFADTAFAAHPAYLCAWFGLEPTASGYGVSWLHDGYSASIPPPFKGAAFTFSDSVTGSATSEPRGALYRRSQVADIDVDAAFQIAQFPSFGGGGTALSPVNSYEALGQFSVWARVSAGTLTDSGTKDMRYLAVSGYELRCSRSGTALVFAVYRWVTGTATLVASQSYTASAPAVWFQLALGLRLVIETVGGNPTIKAYVGPITINGVQFSSYQLFQANGFTVTLGTSITNASGTLTDAHAGKLTAAGHVGFGMMRDRTLTTGTLSSCKVVDLCSRFRARTIAGTVLFEDNWNRIGAAAAIAAVTDGQGTSGRMLCAEWLSDQYADGATYTREFAWDSTNDRATWTAAGAGPYTRGFLAQRLADNDRNQHRSASINFDTAGSEPTIQAAGLILRGTSTGSQQFTGYAAYVHVDYAGANTYTLKLSRFKAGTETVLATKALAASVAVGTPFVLDLEVFTHPNSPDAGGAVKIKIKLDTVAQSMTLGSAGGILLQDSNNSVVDASADRIQSGYGEGLFAYHAGANVRLIAFDTWTQQALTSGATDPDEMATIAVLGEGTASGSLNDVIRADFPYTEDYEWRTLRHPFESGHVATRPSETTRIRIFRFAKRGMTEDERDDLVAFFDDHDGIETPFNWTPPFQTTAIKVAMVEDSLRVTWLHRNSYSVEFTLVELLA